MLVAVLGDAGREGLELRDLGVRAELLARFGHSLRLGDAVAGVRHGGCRRGTVSLRNVRRDELRRPSRGRPNTHRELVLLSTADAGRNLVSLNGKRVADVRNTNGSRILRLTVRLRDGNGGFTSRS